MPHPSFGPLSPEEFTKLRDAPAGAALQRIRKDDPLWGRSVAPGEMMTWKARVRRTVRADETATVEIEAATAEEAEKFLDQMDWEKFSWHDDGCSDPDDYEVVDVVPA